MKSMIKELWHGNIIPQEDSRNNSKEMKELLGYMARHHEDLAKTFTDEQKEIFEFREVDFNPSYPFYMFVQLRFGLDSVNFSWRKKP